MPEAKSERYARERVINGSSWTAREYVVCKCWRSISRDLSRPTAIGSALNIAQSYRGEKKNRVLRNEILATAFVMHRALKAVYKYATNVHTCTWARKNDRSIFMRTRGCVLGIERVNSNVIGRWKKSPFLDAVLIVILNLRSLLKYN